MQQAEDIPLTHVERGRLGGRARWGPRRIVRLDELDVRVAAAVRALIAADEAAKKAAPTDENVGTAVEVRRAAGERSD